MFLTSPQHEYVLNAVTAAAFYQSEDGLSYVLVGEGCFLKVLEAETSRLAAQCKIFSAQTIHGIAVNDSDSQTHGIGSILWGGTSFLFLSTEDIESIVRGVVKSVTDYENFAPDWILDGTISLIQDFAGCVFVTAHSAILRVCGVRDGQKTILRSLQSQSRSVLYSAHAVWTSPSSILVAGGTVFGEIEVTIWQKMTGGVIFQSRQIGVFNGHEGSVFGVRISPEILGQDGIPTRYLASCSDDRTIRLWELPMTVGERSGHDLDTDPSSKIRETGFGDNGSSITTYVSHEKCLAVVMAHASRIWHVEFITWKSTMEDCNAKLHLLSFGEDSTCQQWSIDFLNMKSEQGSEISRNLSAFGTAHNSTNSAILTHLHTFTYHNGKHIWSTAVSNVGGESRRLVTGGADGKVALYDIFQEISEYSSSLRGHENGKANSLQAGIPCANRSWTLCDISREVYLTKRCSDDVSSREKGHSEISHPSTSTNTIYEPTIKRSIRADKDVPNRYGFVGENELLVTTSLGRVLLISISESIRWEDLDVPDKVSSDLKSYSILLGIPGFSVALLAGANGIVYMYYSKVVTELVKVQGKPAAFFDVSSIQDKQINIIITSLGNDIAYRISIAKFKQQAHHLVSLKTVELPSSFVVTGAGDIGGLTILGARNGSIGVYDIKSSRTAKMVITGKEARIDDAITAIIELGPASILESRSHFLTTNRNGSYSIFILSMTRDQEKTLTTVSVQLVHQVFPPFGPMIEAAWFDNSDLLLFGFRSKDFIVWNETKQCEVTSIECGGAHRSYAYMAGRGTGGSGIFAYTKASKLRIHSQPKPSHKVLKSGGHGREIKAAAIHKDFIATGAEDTVIRIWRIKRDSTSSPKVHVSVDGDSGKHGNISMECCTVLEKHTTGIQHLRWSCSTGEYHSLFSAGGAEEFNVWAVSDIPGFGVGVICEATLTNFSENRDLRIMSFDVDFIPDRRPRLAVQGKPSPPLGKNEIVLIYSDSTIRFYEYSKIGGFRKLAQGMYTSACLTQVDFVRESPGSRKCFTAATDGYIALWDCSPQAQDPNGSVGASPLAGEASSPTSLGLKPILRLRLHQSSISALAIQALTLLSQPGGLLVVTAGDDNALCITFFHNLTPVKRIVIPSAHAAGITGLEFKSDITGGMSEDKWYQLWTVGGDQRVKRWTIELGYEQEYAKATMKNGLNMRVWSQGDGDDVWCSVADPGGLVEWRDNWDEDFVLIYGNGMEIFKLEDGFPNGDGTRWAGIIQEEPKPKWLDEEEYEEE